MSLSCIKIKKKMFLNKNKNFTKKEINIKNVNLCNKLEGFMKFPSNNINIINRKVFLWCVIVMN